MYKYQNNFSNFRDFLNLIPGKVSCTVCASDPFFEFWKFDQYWQFFFFLIYLKNGDDKCEVTGSIEIISKNKMDKAKMSSDGVMDGDFGYIDAEFCADYESVSPA